MRKLWVNYRYWTQDILRFEYRVLLCILLVSGVLCLVIGGLYAALTVRGKWINSAGLLFDVSGVVQLHVSGLFDRIINKYGDVTNYPFGPPSRITRAIIDDPEAPVKTWLRNFLFFEANTGFHLLLAGFVFQLIGTWA